MGLLPEHPASPAFRGAVATVRPETTGQRSSQRLQEGPVLARRSLPSPPGATLGRLTTARARRFRLLCRTGLAPGAVPPGGPGGAGGAVDSGASWLGLAGVLWARTAVCVAPPMPETWGGPHTWCLLRSSELVGWRESSLPREGHVATFTRSRSGASDPRTAVGFGEEHACGPGHWEPRHRAPGSPGSTLILEWGWEAVSGCWPHGGLRVAWTLRPALPRGRWPEGAHASLDVTPGTAEVEGEP